MIKKSFIIGLSVVAIALTRTALVQIEKDVIFQPETQWLDGFTDSVRGLGLEEVYIENKSGRLNALYQEKDSEEVFLFCHGNAGNMSYNTGNIANLESSGRSYLLFDYPGYGKSEGKASESSLYDSGQAAYDYLIKERKISADQIILSGQSLGAAVCLNIAANNPSKSVIAESGFISTKEVAKDMIGALPSLIASNLFDNRNNTDALDEPVLFIHGTDDQTLNKRHSKTLFERSKDPKYIIYLEGLDHNQFVLDPEGELAQRLEVFYKTSILPEA